MRLSIITPPAWPMVSLDDVKHHMHVEHDDDDDQIGALIEVATEQVEGRFGLTGKQFRRAVYALEIDGAPPSRWQLPLPPLASVEEITYRPSGASNDRLTVSGEGFRVHAASNPGLVCAEPHWPKGDFYAVVFSCGYEDTALVPAPVKHAVRMLTAHLYENREATTRGAIGALPMGVSDLLRLHTSPHPYYWRLNYGS